MGNELIAFLERVLHLSDAHEEKRGDTLLRDRLSAIVGQDAAPLAAEIPRSTWAAYLEGTLDPVAHAATEEKISASPALMEEVASLREVIDRVSQNATTMPSDLAAEIAGLGLAGRSEASDGFGLKKVLDALGAVRGKAGSVCRSNVLDIVLGKGREACEIIVRASSDLMSPSQEIWSFAPGTALVTRAGSAGPAIIEGAHALNQSAVTITADQFEGNRRIEIVVRDLPVGTIPTVLLATNKDDGATATRLEPTAEIEPKTGRVRLYYELEDLPSGSYVLLIEEPDPATGK